MGSCCLVLQVPSYSAGTSLSARCQFGATLDGAYICVVRYIPHSMASCSFCRTHLCMLPSCLIHSQLWPFPRVVFTYALSMSLNGCQPVSVQQQKYVHVQKCFHAWHKCVLAMQGNMTGDVYVYDTADGRRMAHVAPIKVSAPVKACGISPDCRHLLAAVGNGFIFRFEYRKPAAEVCTARFASFCCVAATAISYLHTSWPCCTAFYVAQCHFYLAENSCPMKAFHLRKPTIDFEQLMSMCRDGTLRHIRPAVASSLHYMQATAIADGCVSCREVTVNCLMLT